MIMEDDVRVAEKVAQMLIQILRSKDVISESEAIRASKIILENQQEKNGVGGDGSNSDSRICKKPDRISI